MKKERRKREHSASESGSAYSEGVTDLQPVLRVLQFDGKICANTN